MVDYLVSHKREAYKEASTLLETIDFLRLDASKRIEKERQSHLGQFFTPAPVARLMVSLFETYSPTITILDAGAGVGSLFAAYIAHLCTQDNPPGHITVVAYEVDEMLIRQARENPALLSLILTHICLGWLEKLTFTDVLLKRPRVASASLAASHEPIVTSILPRVSMMQDGAHFSNG